VGRGSTFRFSLELPRGDPRNLGVRPERDLALPPLAILVVDDNATNIKVALRLLERLGQSPEQARCGRDALTALCDQAYDVVLLDIEMPDMDGFEVTRRIRSGEAGPLNRDVPVIAMTAHSLRTFRNDCLAAGMQGFLAKPMELERLHAVLSGLARRKGRPGRFRVAAGNPVAGAELDVAAALSRLDGDRRLYRGVFEDFVDKYHPDRLPGLGTGPADLEAVIRFVHTLKGVARTLGAEALAVLAERVEATARDGRPDGVLALLSALRERFDRDLAAIGRTVEAWGPLDEAPGA
jgi:CheY-like chemotaxis protein